MKVTFFLLISFLSVLLSCTSKTEAIVINPGAAKYKVKTIVVFPFENMNEKKFRSHYPNAPQVVYESLETYFLGLNVQIADRNHVDKILKEIRFSGSGLTDSDGKRIGKMLDADAVIIGKITSYVQGAGVHDTTGKLENTRFGFSIKAIHVESGMILARVNMYQNLGGLFSYTSPVENLVNRMMEDLVKKLKRKGL
ncbi:MAG: CsgG/HfaB family protein [Spirochaetia bacterium]|nr:CsgG/HfaB family protein [Spirochaetia bacterium]